VRVDPGFGAADSDELPAVAGVGDRVTLTQTVTVDDPVCVRVLTHARGRSTTSAPTCVLVTTAGVVPAADLALPLDLAVGRCAAPAPGQVLAGRRPWLRVVPCGPTAAVEVFRRVPLPRPDGALAAERCGADAPGTGPYQAWWGLDEGGRAAVVCAWRR
jgi:hypothetical protein